MPHLPGHSFNSPSSSSASHSYSANQPTPMRTFGPPLATSCLSGSSASPSDEFLRKSAPLRVEDLQPPEVDPKPIMAPPPPPPKPKPNMAVDATQLDLGLDLETPRSQIGANYIRKYYNGQLSYPSAGTSVMADTTQHDSCMESTALSDEEDAAGSSVAQYSCADMSDVLRSTALRTPGVADISEDAESTTTSGSYVVDPQELVNEIDDLFFRDMMV